MRIKLSGSCMQDATKRHARLRTCYDTSTNAFEYKHEMLTLELNREIAQNNNLDASFAVA